MIYEILSIVPSKFSDTEIDGVIERFAQTLERLGTRVLKNTNLGKIKLAYPIKKVTHATYVLTYLEDDGSHIKKIDETLRLSDDLLRHTIVKRPEGVAKTPITLVSYQEPLNPEGKPTVQKVKKTTQVPTQEKEEKKMSVDDLDRQLDEILDSDLTNV